MRFVNEPGNNLVLNPPQNWDAEKHGECQAITVLRLPDSFVATIELEQSEFAELLKGGKLKFRIFGNGFPPVALWVEPKP